MKPTTLVSKRLYFGVEAVRLRDATGRVLERVAGVPPERATVGLQALAEDFKLSTAASRAMADEMIESGLLERLTPTGQDFAITERFRRIAMARIIEPLPRAHAQLLISHIKESSARFNQGAVSNKYEIEAVAVFGSYMSLDEEIPELSLGVTGRRRITADRPAAGRATQPTEGHEQIRKLFEDMSSYIRVNFHQRLQDVPRPFSVIFRDDG